MSRGWLEGERTILHLELGWPGPIEGDLLCTPAGASYRALRVVDGRRDGVYSILVERLPYRSVRSEPGVWTFQRVRRGDRGFLIRRTPLPVAA